MKWTMTNRITKAKPTKSANAIQTTKLATRTDGAKTGRPVGPRLTGSPEFRDEVDDHPNTQSGQGEDDRRNEEEPEDEEALAGQRRTSHDSTISLRRSSSTFVTSTRSIALGSSAGIILGSATK